MEVKSFVNRKQYNEALAQAARYGKSLAVDDIWLALFIEAVDDENRQKFERTYQDKKTGVVVHPIFLVTGR